MDMSRHPTSLFLPMLAALCAGLAGCADIDPNRREGMWQPEGVTSGNLAAMVATPTDLARGRGVSDDPGDEAAAPVLLLQKNGPGAKPLASSSSGSGGS